MGHHDDACTLFMPCFKSLFSPNGARAVGGNNSCANGTFGVNTTLNNSIGSLTSSLHILQHIGITTIIRTTIVPPLKLATMVALGVH